MYTTKLAQPRSRKTQISIEPRGDNLDAVTQATRYAALDAAALGYITQVWTWRGGEAVMVNRSSRSWPGDWVAIVRQGLRRGVPVRVFAGSMKAAMDCLGIPFRIKSVRRRPVPPDPSSRAGRRRVLVRAVHRRGNRWRTLRAKIPRDVEQISS